MGEISGKWVNVRTLSSSYGTHPHPRTTGSRNCPWINGQKILIDAVATSNATTGKLFPKHVSYSWCKMGLCKTRLAKNQGRPRVLLRLKWRASTLEHSELCSRLRLNTAIILYFVADFDIKREGKCRETCFMRLPLGKKHLHGFKT